MRTTHIDKASGYSQKATVLRVDDARLFPAGSQIYCPRTQETMFVGEAQADNEILVTRGYRGTRRAALRDDDELVKLPTEPAPQVNKDDPLRTLIFYREGFVDPTLLPDLPGVHWIPAHMDEIAVAVKL